MNVLPGDKTEHAQNTTTCCVRIPAVCGKCKEIYDNDQHRIHDRDYFWVLGGKIRNAHAGAIKCADSLYFLN